MSAPPDLGAESSRARQEAAAQEDKPEPPRKWLLRARQEAAEQEYKPESPSKWLSRARQEAAALEDKPESPSKWLSRARQEAAEQEYKPESPSKWLSRARQEAAALEDKPESPSKWLSRARQEAAEQDDKPEPPRKWLALVSVVDFPGNEDDERARAIQVGTDVLLARNEPPLLSKLVLHPRVAPDPRSNNEPLSAYILSAERSGFLLLQVMEGNRPDFFLCNTRTSTITILPPVSSYIKGLDIEPLLSIGLIADPHHHGHYVVAQLHPTTSNDDRLGLLCYSTATGQWSTRDITVKQGRVPNPFSETGVLAHDGHLWWISLAHGVFFCDPCTPHPQLRFVRLPPGCEMAGDVDFDLRIRTLLDQRRCVRLSKGKLRFVKICGLSYDELVDADAPPANLMIFMWTLDNPEGQEPWTLDHMVFFADIWENETYAAAGLQASEVPHVALVDPNDNCVVYFLQGSKLFGVNMRETKVVACFDMSKKVVGCEQCPIDRDQIAFRSSRPIVDAWEVPPPPPMLPGDDYSSADDDVWSTQSYVEKKKLQVTESVDSWLNQVRLEWTRDTDALVENWRAWQVAVAPPPSDESSHESSDESSDEQLIPSSLGDIQSPTPPPICLVCQQCSGKEICSQCILQVKHNLLDISEGDMKRNGGYCLECNECVEKAHHHIHEGKIIPLEYYNGKMSAWVKGNEKWASIFDGIQSDSFFHIYTGRPFLIYRPEAIRCKWCNDVLTTTNLLYGSLTSFCSLNCWMKFGNGIGEAAQIAEILLATQFTSDLNSICLTCNSVFFSTEGNDHKGHDRLAVVTDNAHQSWVQIPPNHHLAKAWRDIKGLEDSSWTGEIIIKHVASDRCQNWNCRTRLIDGGGRTCSLECSAVPNLLPRSVLRQADDEPDIQIPPSP